MNIITIQDGSELPKRCDLQVYSFDHEQIPECFEKLHGRKPETAYRLCNHIFVPVIEDEDYS